VRAPTPERSVKLRATLAHAGHQSPARNGEGTLDAMPVRVVLLLDDALILVCCGLPDVGGRGVALSPQSPRQHARGDSRWCKVHDLHTVFI
jgi:hypothetical protein